MRKVHTRLIICSVFLLFFSTGLTHAQNYFTSVGGPYGGGFSAIKITSDGTIYAGTGTMGFADGSGGGGDGIYKSVNGGSSWTHAGLENYYISAIENDNSGNIYAGCYDGEEPWDYRSPKGVFRSSDGGKNWERIGLDNYAIYDIHFVPGKGLYASTGYSGVYKWNGTGWDEFQVNSSSNWVQCLASNSAGDIFAGTTGGLYLSTDGGSNWTELNKQNVYQIAILSTGRIVALSNPKIFLSDNNGTTWTEATGSYYFSRHMTVSSNGNLYTSDYYDGVRVSTDGGKNWQPVINGFTSTSFAAIAADSIGNIYAGSFKGFGIYKLTNQGANWSSVSNGIKNSMISTICVTPEGNIYTGGNNGINYSADGASNWQNVWQKNWHFDEKVNDIEFFNNKIYAATNKSYVQVSVPGSSEWSVSSAGMTANARVNCIQPVGSNILLAGTDGEGIFRSTDFGSSWTKSGGYGYLRVFDMANEPDGNVICAAGYSIYRSTDSGVTWDTDHPLNYGGTMAIHKLAVNSSGHIFAGTMIGLYRSTDKGQTFEWIGKWPFTGGTSGAADVFDVAINSSGYIYAGVGRGYSFGVYASLDNGDSWTKVSDWVSGYSVRSLALSPSQTLFAGTYNAGLFKTNVATRSEENELNVPTEFVLHQNYPNPFNPETTIRYSIPTVSASHEVRTPYMASLRPVSLKVYDILGRKIRTLVNGAKAPGNYEVKFDGSELSSGLYIYRIQSGNFIQSRKMLLLK